MKHHSPHSHPHSHSHSHSHDSDSDADPQPGQLPVAPDDGRVPTGLPDEPQEDGIVDPQA